ncbi:MAG: 23S rRNA (pseudouridine(1915)-N(3))-methyltransferase RlmH [Desulfovibrio sp.]|jgi:23S rRNA (pseudouridine1915-N3)-methyltransferase|nr:23S rRNA (pseudouridine(1915)-N(3))-methyltransferase RlmH [Desulfovibrio sp.]
MRTTKLIAVGRMRCAFWNEACARYTERLRRWGVRFEEAVVKDGTAGLSPAERKEQEGERILGKVRPADAVLCLDERGREQNSAEFAAFVRGLHDAGRVPCFVVGGPDGQAPRVLAAAEQVLSLGRMTLPHELARVLLLEQLYRAENIIRNTPYHR